ncbi:hypothetical protein SAMN04487967_1044 [Natronorubrum sediminis]|uniref:Uncharacterized protein n=2 Tax=Natronorubrum sediminis TaxID=640943 RepID=A0A1H6FSS9_9EURY|nr:hypothetical protein [Natronorubrum sediminis]SEH12943.1 hypothetical protein SAMN04487967_1044 [Natronorubrum sediminis]
MASSELHHSDQFHQSLHLERVESVTSDATVRHVDQLETETLETIYAALEGNGSIPATDVDLEVGEIIVFTEYRRVVRP